MRRNVTIGFSEEEILRLQGAAAMARMRRLRAGISATDSAARFRGLTCTSGWGACWKKRSRT